MGADEGVYAAGVALHTYTRRLTQHLIAHRQQSLRKESLALAVPCVQAHLEALCRVQPDRERLVRAHELHGALLPSAVLARVLTDASAVLQERDGDAKTGNDRLRSAMQLDWATKWLLL